LEHIIIELRVEKEHTANVGNFKAVPDMKLPIPEISYDINLREVVHFLVQHIHTF